MARASRLKVYRTSAGFDDAYVAAPSQAAALKAWGARGDLFGNGEAEVVTDEALTAEPLTRPGEVIRRPRGDLAAMLAATPKPKPLARAAEKPRPQPDKGALNAAEKAVSAARERLSREMDAIAQERADLDEQEQRTRRVGEAEVKRLEASRAAAERAFRRAGG